MNSKAAVNKEPLKFKWSHHSKVHVTLVKAINRIARLVPWGLKYSLITKLKRNSFPYCLINSGDTVLQIGAPLDTMESGRSRAILFAHMTGDTGKVVVIEPDSASAEKIAALNSKGSYRQLALEKSGAWSHKGNLDFYIDDEHPATNFTGDARTYDASVMEKYRKVQVPVDTVDNILAHQNVDSIKLISITTNGAEEEILSGMQDTLDNKGVEYVCLARTGEGYHSLMERYGYVFHAYDDRGYCYKRR